MSRIIDQIPNRLNKTNIEKAIVDYLKLLENIPLKIQSENVLKFLTVLKREKICSGPYPNVTLFESANRIMTDLTILYGIRELLNGAIEEIDYPEYTVEFGNDNYSDNDISAMNGNSILIGEGFNVAKSFFQAKKTNALSKMRSQEKNSTSEYQILLMYNSEAVSEKYNPKNRENEYHLKVSLKYE